MTLLSLAFLMALTSFFASSATPVAGRPGIAPHLWEMTSFTHAEDAPVEVGNPARYSAQFLPDGEVAFTLDCNSGQADYIAADGRVALANLETSDARCPSGSHSVAFAGLLSTVENYRFDDEGNLILRGPQGAIRLRPALTGVTWQWQGIADNDGSMVVALTAPERYTLEFLTDGALVIHTDCNRGRARAKIDGIAMAIHIDGVTRMACLAGSLSNLYLTGLTNVEHWYLFNGVLTLSLPDGAGAMIFSPVVNTGANSHGAN